MKFETLTLQTLFAACFLLCVLTLGAMLTTPSPAALTAAGQPPVQALPHSAS